MKSLPEVRAELLDMLPRGGKVYMIVGTMTFDSADIKHSGSRTKNSQADGRVPVLQAAAAASGIPIPVSGGTVEIAGAKADSSDWTVKSSTVDEEVFAVEYRVITRDWGGYGGEPKFRDSIPDFQGGLTYGAGDEEEDDEDEDGAFDEEASVLEEGITSRDAGLFLGREAVLDPGTGFLYYPD
jgi:hypothetical protein